MPSCHGAIFEQKRNFSVYIGVHVKDFRYGTFWRIRFGEIFDDVRGVVVVVDAAMRDVGELPRRGRLCGDDDVIGEGDVVAAHGAITRVQHVYTVDDEVVAVNFGGFGWGGGRPDAVFTAHHRERFAVQHVGGHGNFCCSGVGIAEGDGVVGVDLGLRGSLREGGDGGEGDEADL